MSSNLMKQTCSLILALLSPLMAEAFWKSTPPVQRGPTPRALVLEDFQRKFEIQFKESLELEVLNPEHSNKREKIFVGNNLIDSGVKIEGLANPYTRFECRIAEETSGTSRPQSKGPEVFKGKWFIQGKLNKTGTLDPAKDRVLHRAGHSFLTSEIHFELRSSESLRKLWVQRNPHYTSTGLKITCKTECEISRNQLKNLAPLRERCSKITANMIAEKFPEIGIHGYPLTVVDPPSALSTSPTPDHGSNLKSSSDSASAR